MKNLNFIFELLLFPFLFFKDFSLFQKSNIHSQVKDINISHILKFLFILPLMFSSLITIQAVADLDSENDTCPPGEILTIGSGTNTFLGQLRVMDLIVLV